jgi:hypothetical protein
MVETSPPPPDSNGGSMSQELGRLETAGLRGAAAGAAFVYLGATPAANWPPATRIIFRITLIYFRLAAADHKRTWQIFRRDEAGAKFRKGTDARNLHLWILAAERESPASTDQHAV